MRIFSGLAIIICSGFLWLLPVSDVNYAWRTDQRTDSFVVETAIGVTTANFTLVKAIYDDDTGTVSIATNITGEVPVLSSYDTTTRQMVISGLTANSTRTIYATYDASAFTSTAFDTIGDFGLYSSYIFLVLFPAVGIVYIVQGVREKWFS